MGAVGQDHNEKQAINFNAFERDTNKGNVTYTNFQYADEGSGVWAFGDAAFDVSFEYAGLCQGACVHTLQVTDFQPLSPTSLSFEGTGVYASNPTWTETFTGTIVGNKIALTLDADDDGALYQWNTTTLSGTITPQGSISGTWKDDIVSWWLVRDRIRCRVRGVLVHDSGDVRQRHAGCGGDLQLHDPGECLARAARARGRPRDRRWCVWH